MDNNDWPWPESLDALIAAPDNHTLLLENERVRVLETHILPGDKTPMHTHRWPSVYHILSWSDFLRADDKGQVIVDSREVDSLVDPPAVMWSEALPPHTLQNVGDKEIRLIGVELKEYPGSWR